MKNVSKLISNYFDKSETYGVNMFQVGKSSSISDPGRPSVANTLGTILLNLAIDGDNISREDLRDAVFSTGDRTLIRNYSKAISGLVEDGHFTVEDDLIHPTEDLFNAIHTSLQVRLDKECEWSEVKSKNSSHQPGRTSRCKSKQEELRKDLKAVELVMKSFGMAPVY